MSRLVLRRSALADVSGADRPAAAVSWTLPVNQCLITFQCEETP